jgi:hypothetical protein
MMQGSNFMVDLVLRNLYSDKQKKRNQPINRLFSDTETCYRNSNLYCRNVIHINEDFNLLVSFHIGRFI